MHGLFCWYIFAQKLYPHYPIHHLDDAGDNLRSKRQTDEYQPYRMAVYLVMENITNLSTNLPLLTNPSGPFQQAITYFESVLSLVRAPTNLVVKPRCTSMMNDICETYNIPTCGPYAAIPAEHLGNITVCDPTCRQVGGPGVGVDADFIYYISVVDDGKSTGACTYGSKLCI